MIKKTLKITVVLSLITIIAAVSAVMITYNNFTGKGELMAAKTITVKKGSSLSAIAKLLHEEGLIKNPHIFKIGVKYHKKGTLLKAGIYDFPPQVSARQIMDMMVQGGREVSYKITIPEGYTTSQIVKLINKNRKLKGSIPPKNDENFEMPAEGSLFPNTYHFAEGDTKASIIRRMQQKMQEVMTDLWEERDENLPFSNINDALILASIVEKETYIDEEKPVIASVFINRLNKSMRLQTDPTVIYALTDGGGKLNRRLRIKDYKLDDPYNTYRIDGLPPGPICNPGEEAIKAVLSPADTDYLFFVASGDGGHAFATTFAEHKINRQKWLKIIRKRRIQASK